MQNIDKILKSLDQSQIGEINRFLSSAQGKNFKNKINSSDKEKLLREFSKLDPSVAASKLRGMSPEQILSLIKKL